MSQKGIARCSGLVSGLGRNCDVQANTLASGQYVAHSRFLCLGAKRRCLSSQSPAVQSAPYVPPPSSNARDGRQVHLGHRAKQRQADKEFFTDLLTSAATKRDAKAYLTRLKDPNKYSTGDRAPPKSSKQSTPFSQPEVNIGNLFGRARAVDQSPVFSQYKTLEAQPVPEVETIHVALVKIVDTDRLDNNTIDGIAQTLSQLSRLSMAPCVVLEFTSTESGSRWRRKASAQAERLAAAIDSVHEHSSRILDNMMSITKDKSPEVFLRKLLLRPLQRGHIPILAPMAYCAITQSAVPVSADDTVLALTREFAGLNLKPEHDQDPAVAIEQSKALQKQISLDRIILVDAAGGIPNTESAENTQVFVNLEQEFLTLSSNLSALKDAEVSRRHTTNLRLLQSALQVLPSSASGLITTPAEAANSTRKGQAQSQVSDVGTRKQKNPLIYNLLTDKPAYSSSLPSSRLSRTEPTVSTPVVSATTFVKRGMPLTILPDPSIRAWSADNHGQSRMKLTDPRIDLPRLVHLIDDSFDRTLDVEAYLDRVNDRIAGIIVAGEYEGGALLTWETPPGAEDGDTSRLVPYLDKFAVLKRSQGAGGVADILFNAMVRDCFPSGVCWRSRKDNPVNKWYFERSRGTWKIPETNWTMFWTTPGVAQNGTTFLDYEGVCRGVQPTWADKKKIVD